MRLRQGTILVTSFLAVLIGATVCNPAPSQAERKITVTPVPAPMQGSDLERRSLPFEDLFAAVEGTPECGLGGEERGERDLPEIHHHWTTEMDEGPGGERAGGCPGRKCLSETHYFELPKPPEEMGALEWQALLRAMTDTWNAFKSRCAQHQQSIECPPPCRLIDTLSETASLVRDIPIHSESCSATSEVTIRGEASCEFCCKIAAATDFRENMLEALEKFRSTQCSAPECTVQMFYEGHREDDNSDGCGALTCNASYELDVVLVCKGASGQNPDTWYAILKLDCCRNCLGRDTSVPTPTPTPTPTPEASPSPLSTGSGEWEG